MSQQDADYYQAHKDDPKEWGEPQPAPKSRRRRLVAMISVRFTPEEEQAVRRAARTTGNSVSNFIRQAALKAAGHRVGGARTGSLLALGWEAPRTTSLGTTTEVVSGTTHVQVSLPPSQPEGILAAS
ncbi:MAG TPA: DUF1778 domain-containing protein [Actinomycetota bacterium]|nr:DUF1778 domain-containing protein [Actinomycetota bacterium]